jgi:hypothetical protein
MRKGTFGQPSGHFRRTSNCGIGGQDRFGSNAWRFEPTRHCNHYHTRWCVLRSLPFLKRLAKRLQNTAALAVGDGIAPQIRGLSGLETPRATALSLQPNYPPSLGDEGCTKSRECSFTHSAGASPDPVASRHGSDTDDNFITPTDTT